MRQASTPDEVCTGFLFMLFCLYSCVETYMKNFCTYTLIVISKKTLYIHVTGVTVIAHAVFSTCRYTSDAIVNNTYRCPIVLSMYIIMYICIVVGVNTHRWSILGGLITLTAPIRPDSEWRHHTSHYIMSLWIAFPQCIQTACLSDNIRTTQIIFSTFLQSESTLISRLF